jgi:hypothetical protein
MTKEELQVAYAAENHHLLYDLDADSLCPRMFEYGPDDDGTEHCIGPVLHLREDT